jgi:hypothetical protein
MNERMLSIESLNSSCFPNGTGLIISHQSRSSLIISDGSLQSNRTYHFRVQLNHIENSSLLFGGD